MHQYYSVTKKVWLPIPGRVYPVRLPIIGQVPALHEHPLIVHRFIGGRSGWTVAHAATSGFIAHGRTRAEAIEAARRVLLDKGNARYLRAIRKLEAAIAAETELAIRSAA